MFHPIAYDQCICTRTTDCTVAEQPEQWPTASGYAILNQPHQNPEVIALYAGKN